MWLMATSLDREKNISIITVSTLGQSVLESLIHQIAKEKQKKKTEKEESGHIYGSLLCFSLILYVY